MNAISLGLYFLFQTEECLFKSWRTYKNDGNNCEEHDGPPLFQSLFGRLLSLDDACLLQLQIDETLKLEIELLVARSYDGVTTPHEERKKALTYRILNLHCRLLQTVEVRNVVFEILFELLYMRHRIRRCGIRRIHEDPSIPKPYSRTRSRPPPIPWPVEPRLRREE